MKTVDLSKHFHPKPSRLVMEISIEGPVLLATPEEDKDKAASSLPSGVETKSVNAGSLYEGDLDGIEALILVLGDREGADCLCDQLKIAKEASKGGIPTALVVPPLPELSNGKRPYEDSCDIVAQIQSARGFRWHVVEINNHSNPVKQALGKVTPGPPY